MRISGNTVLITGGTSGIGFELASQLRALDNFVIVTGRDPVALGIATKKLPGVHAIRSDVSDPAEIDRLHQRVIDEFPGLNVLVNNAGIMRKINLARFATRLDEVTREIDIDLSGPIRMCIRFLPHLINQAQAAIVNVSSGLAFVPTPISPVYCASKAGLHSFTQSLRIQLRTTGVSVFELAPPLTQTALFKDDLSPLDVAGVKPMDVTMLVKHAIDGIKNDRPEIRPGLSNVLKLMSRVAPDFILNRLSKSVDRMFAER